MACRGRLMVDDLPPSDSPYVSSAISIPHYTSYIIHSTLYIRLNGIILATSTKTSYMKKIAILATDGFEQSELEKPMQAMKDAGHTVEVISLKSGAIKGWNKKNWGAEVPVDKTVDSASAGDYHAVILPGGVM